MGTCPRWFQLLVFLKQCAVWMISQQPSNINGADVGLCFWQMKLRRDLSDSKIKNSNWEPKAQIQIFPQKEFYFYKTKTIMDLCVSLINHQGLLSFPRGCYHCLDLDNTPPLSHGCHSYSSFFTLFSHVSNFCVMETNHPRSFIGRGGGGCFKPF